MDSHIIMRSFAFFEQTQPTQWIGEMVKKAATKKQVKAIVPASPEKDQEMEENNVTLQENNQNHINQLSERFEKIATTANNNTNINYSSILSNIINNTNNAINTQPKDSEYKKKYIELKDKFTLFKKMKHTDTENLFEDFKIAAEKRDSDSKKYISQLKFQVEVLQQKNKLLNEALNNKYGCDYDNLQKQLNDRRDLEEKFKLEQIKQVLNDKIKEDDKVISQLNEEKNSLISQMAEMKEEFERKMQSANQQFESLIEKHTNERYESQRAVDSMSSEVNDRLAESRRMIAQLQGENEALTTRLNEMVQENKDRSNLFQDGKQKLIDEWMLADKQKAEDFESRIIEVKNYYEQQMKKLKQANEDNIIKIHDEFVQSETKLKKLNDQLLDQKNVEISVIEKQLTEEIEQLEDKRLKEHQDSLKSQRSLAQELQELKSKLDTIDSQNKLKQNYLQLYHKLTSIKLNQVSDSKYEMLAQSQKNTLRKIQGEIVITDSELSYTPISIDNCSSVAECVENPVDIPLEDSSIFVMKLIETIYA
ncbi:hypothetical protein PPL_12309 [Heterostelium album PN500]|uniref:Uncharacterized protein n=1 Tax=Heterostelium pallidum (strain ATCC 26659 / Pp 5 / PN500) TaxID=670386 RepID=D3BM99_HETP5|nr:hypothetical protein PPL_12309 [Heterostelium album PN500]EFA77700.1 hypothetical protein PPL_12309 [Heterostelium album PN500]|eukprot:XP_020429828.1 hypothetical protein PPL_12309 [Heterostelium album PN500]